MSATSRSLAAFLDRCPSLYHAVEQLRQEFDAAGYTRLQENAQWTLIPGGKYYLIRGGSAFVAFSVPQAPEGFTIAACHDDRPGFKVKDDLAHAGTYTRLSVEGYGGMLMSTWLDRPLGIAGRVFVETDDGIACRLVNLDKDIALIPSVAIHMNRDANAGYKWNPAVDLVPLLGGKESAPTLRRMLEKAAGGKILGHDLFLYPRQKATHWGLNREFISAAGLDDLACVWGCAQGMLKSENSRAVKVLCVFDSEEVGSCSSQGADSTLLTDVLTRICDGLSLSYHRMLANSFLLSADNAHAIHPNHPEYADSHNAPVLGGGVVLKFNANLSYTTDGLSAAALRKLWNDAGVPVQTYYNRADLRGGSTLGHISSSHISVPSADIGLAQLAMHSCYETAGVQDVDAMETALTAYFAACFAGLGN